jgi:hypothetical protein
VGRQRLVRLVENAHGPFFVTIRKFGRAHFSIPRFIAGTGAGWKPEPPPLKVPDKPIKLKGKQRKPRSQQSGFWETPMAASCCTIQEAELSFPADLRAGNL